LLTYAQEDVNTTNETFILPFVESRVEAIPTTVQACGELVFSGAESFDSRGDPLQFFWGFGPGTPSWFRTPRLSTLLEEATATSADSVVVSPWVLSEAGARLGEELREGEVRLEVRLIVRNALGNSTEAVVSAGVVGSTAQAEPVIFPVGSNDVQLKHSERLILSVVTSEAPFALSCALRDPGRSAGRTNITWEYRGFGQAFRTLEDLATSNPRMRDLSEDPNTVELAPYALQPGSFHLLRAVAAFDTRPTLAPRANVVFRISVEPLPALEVHIIGPRVASQCGFELDASQVWDPTLPSSNLSDFLFEWRCSSIVQVGELDICANLPGLGAAGPRLMVGPGLLPGVHRFSVFVRRKTGGPSAVARNPVRVQNTSFATLSLTFPRYAYTGKLNLTDGIPPVSAVVDASGQAGPACLVPEVHWQWVLVEDRLLPRLDRILPTRAETVGNMLELQSDVGDDGLLLPGVPYYHVLLQSDNQSTLAAAVAGVLDRPPLENVLRNGVVAAIISPEFLAEEPPAAGLITVQPSSQGLSLGTTFVVETSMWTDERPAELEYEFLAFPLQELPQGADPLPDLQIDWEDPQNPQYWKELGGQLLRPWGRLPQALVHMPAGLYQLVVRARDDEGAVAMTSSPEPLIVEAEQNFTVPYVEAFLATVQVTNNVGQLLQAAIAVAVTADPIVRQKECSTDFFGTVTCKQIPAQEVVRPAFEMLTAAAPYIWGDMVGKLGAAVMMLLKTVSVTVVQTVDVTNVFGDSLDPRNLTENGTEPDDVPAGTVLWNVSRHQIPLEFTTTAVQLLATTQERLLLDQAVDPKSTLDRYAGEEVWAGIAMILSGLQLADSAAAAASAQQVQGLVDGLGASTLPRLRAGQGMQLVAMEPNFHTEMLLAKEPVGSDVRLPGILVPRQLGLVGAQGCDEMEVQVTSWSNLNPRFWAPRGFGVTDLVLPNTSMKGVYLRRCGEPIFQQGLANPLEIDIDISQPEGVYPGYLVEFMCAVFDEGLGAWSTAGMSSKHVITNVSTEMTCLATRSSGLFAALFRVVREEPPNTTTPLPPPPEVDEGLTLGALLAIVGGGTVLLCGCTGGLYAWHKMRSREPVEPEPEEEEEEVVETESESEIAELPDPDPALTKLRLAAEAGTLTAREILANHSGPMGIRQELVWALDKGYEKKRREAQAKVFQKDTVKEELADLAKSDSGDDASGASFTPIHAKAPAKKMRRQQSPGQSDPRSSRTSRGSGSRRNSGSRRRSEQSGKSRQSGQSGPH